MAEKLSTNTSAMDKTRTLGIDNGVNFWGRAIMEAFVKIKRGYES